MDKKITISKIIFVPNKNTCTNFGGLCSYKKTIYACKTNGDETITTIYKFDSTKDTTATTKKFTKLGHANGMAYYKSNIYIPIWDKKGTNSNNSIAKINFAKGTKTIIKGNGTKFTSIAHYSGNYFIVGAGGVKFQLIKMLTGNKYEVCKTFRVKNIKAENDYTVSQDCYIKNKILYIPMAHKDLTKSAILLVNLGDNIINGNEYIPYEVWLSSSSTDKHEIESMTIDSDGHILFGLNTSKDGIFIKK